MYSVILVIHVMTTIALIGIVLVQRSSSDGMGLTSSSSNSLLSGRSAANFATRTTSILATIFILTSLSLGFIISHNHVNSGSLADKIANRPANAAPVTPDKAPATPAAPIPDAAPSNKEAPATVPVPAQSAPADAPATAPTVPIPSAPKKQ